MKIREAFSRSSPRQPPPWIELPDDVTANILRRLCAIEILENAQNVWTSWRRICQDPSMWRAIHVQYYRFGVSQYHTWRRAVDQSQGQLVDLNMYHMGDDDLLNCILDRSSRLRRINLYNCNCVTGKGLADAIKKLPDLQEIRISTHAGFSAEEIQSIGTSCPMLKSFIYENFDPSPDTYGQNAYYGIKFNDRARAIAASMPNLHQLSVWGDWLDHEGLEVILDGCPLLKSLDLRQCNELYLRGANAIARRLSDQIKHVRYPSDSCCDIEWLCSDYGFVNIIPPESPEEEVFSCVFGGEFYTSLSMYQQ